VIKSSAHRAPEAVHGTRRVAMRGRNKREARLARMSHGRPNEVSLRLKWLHKPVQCSCLCLTRARSSSVRAVPHARAQHMHLALPDPSVKWKRHDSAMPNAMRPWPPSTDPHRWEHASGRHVL